MTRDRKASGEWGKPRPGRITETDVQTLPPCTDRDMLERLLGAQPELGGYVTVGELSRFRLHDVLLHELLPRVCAERRCMARVAAADAGEGALPTPGSRHPYGWGRRPPPKPKRPPSALLPLEFDPGGPWQFDARILRDESAGAFRIEAGFVRDAERMNISEPLLVLADGLLITRTHVARLEHGGAFAWLAALRHAGAVTIPVEARLSLVDAMLASPIALRDAPEDLRIEPESAARAGSRR
jgi:hypothetical protein